MSTHTTPNRGSAICALILALFLAAGCATPPDLKDPEAVAEYAAVNDPLEPANRTIFGLNKALDSALLKPAATAYRDYTPDFLQDGLHNMMANLRSPVIFLNDVLQGEPKRAAATFMRFWINSVFGAAGFMDMATGMGIEGHNEDFGQTLAVWGFDEGPFVMLPIFGPSNPRDTVGIVVDFLIDPFNIWAANTDRDYATFARAGTQAIDLRSRNLDLLDDLEKSSLDFYAAIRSLYRQRRTDEITNGKGSANVPVPGLSEGPRRNAGGPSLDDGQEISRSR